MLPVGLGLVRGVAGIHRRPHHVRELVGVAEVVEEKARRALCELVEDAAVLGDHLVTGKARLLEELVHLEHALGERLGVFGHALRVEAAALFGQLGGVGGGRRDRRVGRHRVVVDRRDVDLELGLDRLEVEAADGVELLARDHRELDRDPVAPFTHFQHELRRVLDFELGGADLGLDVDLEVDGESLLLLEQRVLGAVELLLRHAVVDVPLVDVAAGQALGGVEELGGVEREEARTVEIGRPHAGQLAARAAGWRIVRRHAQHPALDAVLLERLPERLALAQRLVAAAGEREPPLAELQREAFFAGLGIGGERHHGRRIAVDEVEDAVAAGVHAGDEVRPRHRALRRHRGLERRELTGPLHARHVGQPALVDQVACEPVVEAVEAEHDDAPVGRSVTATRQGENQVGEQRDCSLQTAQTSCAPTSMPEAGSHATFRFGSAAGSPNSGLPSMCFGGRMPNSVEHGGREVEDRRVVGVELAVAEEDARHQPRIDAVIAAPRLDVVGRTPRRRRCRWRSPTTCGSPR